MRQTDKNALLIFNRGGAIPACEWHSGFGKYRKYRPMPAHCCWMTRSEFPVYRKTGRLHDKVIQTIDSIFTQRPGLQNLIVVHDYDALRLLSAKERLTN